MAFELAYISKNGTHSFLTTKFGFTHKAKDHYQWTNLDQMRKELITIKAEHSSMFNTRKNNHFYIYNVETNSLTVFDWSKKPNLVNVKDTQPDNEKKPYVIAIDTKEGRYYLNTKLDDNGKFIDKLDKETRYWNDLQKARATILSLRLNNKFWVNYPRLASPRCFRVRYNYEYASLGK